ncbi:MAG: anaerobic ribonucleoside-triphosphate reductase activating protein [Lachnospiraceae bacterium]|nr:anaerobic ribonucleoside-triphosphate reductase activating protein [Lachnospiraceae bacterium]
MNYGQIFETDIANGIGCRTSVFVSGCRHHCRECFNSETWNFDFGVPFTEETEDEIIESLKPDYIDGLSLLGGEPMEPENQPTILKLLRRVKKEVPKATVWMYSGYIFEELSDKDNKSCHVKDIMDKDNDNDVTDSILSMLDILVDGEFQIDKKDITLHFRGSSNQRIIDVPMSLKKGSVVLATKYM